MEYTTVTPIELKHLKEINILSPTNYGFLSCRIVLCDPDSDRDVSVTFEDVQDLKIAKLSGCSLIGPLKVLDMRNRQLEKIKYKVMDFEEENLSFLCSGFLRADENA